MKYLSKIILGVICLAAFLAACDKADVINSYKTGTATILSSNTTTIAPPASDSDNTVVKFSWTNPNYATDSSTIKYTIQIDSSGKNFSSPVNIVVTGALWDTLTGRQINNIVLNTYGLKIGIPYSFDVRLISSYANNNDQKISNTVTLSFKAYAVPPKITPPSSGHLYIIGGATVGSGWNQPADLPTHEFSQIDSVTYGGVFYLTSGSAYDFLPVNGSWDTKYNVTDASATGIANGGDFQYSTGPGNDIPSPAVAGWYVIIVDFQAGKFTVTPLNDKGEFTGNLFIIGGATVGGWNQPVPTPTQQFVQDNSAEYHLTLPLAATQEYLLIPTNGSYNKYSLSDAEKALPNAWAGGTLGIEQSQNFPAPPTDGTYTITVNFATNTYTVK